MSKLAPTPVQRILLHCCAVPDDRGRQRLRQLLAGFGDWEVLLDQGERIHRFSPMLFQHLGRHCQDLVPAGVLEQLAKSYRDNVTRTFQQTAALLRLAEGLDQAGVRWISYKGPVLAQTLYGDLGLRHSIDVDLLVSRNGFARVQEILRSHGMEAGPGGRESEDVPSSASWPSMEVSRVERVSCALRSLIGAVSRIRWLWCSASSQQFLQ